MSKSNGGILLSSHIMTDVEKIASHIIIMKDGEILLNEEKDKVLESYTVIDVDEGQLAELDEDIVLAKGIMDLIGCACIGSTEVAEWRNGQHHFHRRNQRLFNEE